MKEALAKKYEEEKKLQEEVSQFDFCNSSLKRLAAKIRLDCAKVRLKNYFL